MSLTGIAISLDRGLSDPEASAGRRTGPHLGGGTIDRDHLLDRLQHLRSILPVFAQELASARRQTAALRVENRGLLDEVRRLRAQRGESSPPRARFDEKDSRMVFDDRCRSRHEPDRV